MTNPPNIFSWQNAKESVERTPEVGAEGAITEFTPEVPASAGTEEAILVDAQVVSVPDSVAAEQPAQNSAINLDAEKVVSLTFKVSLAERSSWKVYAAKHNITMTELVRIAVNKYVI